MDDDIVTGSNTKMNNIEIVIEKKNKKVEADLNNDGKVDKKDKSLAAKILATGKKKK